MSSADSFWHDRPVALTGATGFVGYHLARRLAQAGAQVKALVRVSSRTDLLQPLGIRCDVAPLDDPAALVRSLRGCDLVFHVAGAVDFADDWEQLRRVNVQGTVNVLTAASAAGVRRVVHTSSIVALGATQERRILDETSSWELGPLHVPYVTTKWEAEQAALAATGIEVVVVNPSSVIGPEDHGPSEFGLVCRRFWKGRIPLHFGGGNNFVDVRDVAAGELLAAQHGRSGCRYFLGGENRSYHDFFTQLARVAGRAIARVQLPTWAAPWIADLERRFPKRARPYLSLAQARLMGWYFYATSARARHEIGYRPRTLRESLLDTHESMCTRVAV